MTKETYTSKIFTRRNKIIGGFAIAIAAAFTPLAQAEIYIVPLVGLVGGSYLSKRSRSYYISFVLWLFFLAPMLRRMIDAQIGAPMANAIIATPILACIGGMPHIRRLWAMTHLSNFRWMIVVLATYAYGAFVGFMLHSPFALVQDLVTWIGPLAFGLYVFDQREHMPEMLETLRDQFLNGTLVMGLYGIYQYAFLASWDATWMQTATITTIGSPEPYAVRVFSTMNAPQTFADFLIFGILLSSDSTRRLRFAAIPVGLLTLLLTNSRSAWVGFAVGLVFTMLFFTAKRRLQIICALLGFGVLMGVASLIPQVNEQFTRRFQTFTDLKADSSVNERLLSQQHAITMFLDRAFGNGFGGGSDDLGPGPSYGVASVQGVYMNDNGVEQFMLTFGWFGSIVFVVGLGGIAVTCFRSPILPSLITTNAVLLALLVQLPTMGMFAAAPGFLLWTAILFGLAIRENASPTRGVVEPVLLSGQQVHPA
jgi:hypothetical protein